MRDDKMIVNQVKVRKNTSCADEITPAVENIINGDLMSTELFLRAI